MRLRALSQEEQWERVSKSSLSSHIEQQGAGYLLCLGLENNNPETADPLQVVLDLHCCRDELQPGRTSDTVRFYCSVKRRFGVISPACVRAQTPLILSARCLATERESVYKLTRTRGHQVVVDERPWVN